MERVTAAADAVTLHVRLTPNASRDDVEAWRTDAAGRGHLTARVRAIPENGKANAALIALLAKQLSIPKRDIDVIRGATSRLKTVRIAAEGPVQARLVAQLEAFADERTPD
ncbi:DUF167 family protein [Maricaulis sp.]|uniref:DUF167 family protein n=1 Tax=Maricaulis sp. TaxID=1486257 RepID=UPI0025F7D844|nr:DUF167 family protein [Maricaulis sp.]MDF1769089.1 DUF167 family protein [Maricaulis sp.]